MKLLDYLMNLPFGEVVNKRALAVFKRCGYIYDYSPWGYLEGCWLCYKDEEDDYVYRDMYEVFSKRNAPRDERTKVYLRDEFHEVYGDTSRFEYKGMFFETKYFSGCFCPYLVKVEPPKKYDTNGRLVPEKRLYYRGYKCAFKHEGYKQDIFTSVSSIERRLHPHSYGKAFTYACHKTCTKGTRYRVVKKSNVNHSMCLWGSII